MGVAISVTPIARATPGARTLFKIVDDWNAVCDDGTLHGKYAFRSEASPTAGGRRLNLALIEFHGDGTYSNLGYTVNTDGTITTGTLIANYHINSDCSGTLINLDGSVQGPIIALEDGSEFYFLRTAPSTLMLAAGTRVGKKERARCN
jgi:hypothetical protein